MKENNNMIVDKLTDYQIRIMKNKQVKKRNE